ncbi:translation initiation factor IF-2 [Candidatus Oleimmundimicrobium sp.]|uniref:translation initiation factor IF-2 n=1 Tax=Candidatus Oleimmundimicrobium sp. TaxID=3060597 RepID=UPI0027160AC7|nr:translation initiation factor IF-2 [Candidatus Oleimmundimicrobium sp.]MDO8885449.1 translation initiation factor IF-2 [Candidatus Oleimmundimicrobium sp.]
MGIRIYELAKELNIPSTELMKKLKENGISVKNHFATIDDVAIKLLKEKFGENISKKTKDKTMCKTEKTEELKQSEPKRMVKEKAKLVSEEKEDDELKLKIAEGSTVKELSEIFKKSPSEIIKILMNLGEMATINQPVGNEAIELLADEFGIKVKIISLEEEIKEEIEEEEEIEEDAKDLKPRPPVVTVMGHVDHGKTLLLDAIRETDVVSTEAGGITQHIGAYQIEHKGKKITFIDTPGHEAFTAMRARGAKITDIAVIVVAADDGVMPQTIEAINHANAAGVPILIAINKIDKPQANPDKVKQQLTEYNLVPEEWGGETVFVNVSAKEKTNIDELLDMILLIAEMEEIKANPKGMARGTVVEAFLDKGRGPVATILLNRGTLKVGDSVVAGYTYGKVRALIDDKGKRISIATSGQPVEIIGWSKTPQAGDLLKQTPDEKKARQISEERLLKKRILEKEPHRHIALEDLFDQIKKGELIDLNIIVKGDTQGSVEALCSSLEKINQEEVRVRVIHKGVGAISGTDIALAAASNAVVVGFNVRPDDKAKALAEKENVDMRMYRVIYQVIEDIEAARKGLLKPTFEEVEKGRVEVREIFKASKIGTIAGCFVTQGEINRKDQVRVVRDGIVVHEGLISSLHRFKEDVASIKSGYECGICLEGFKDLKVGDILEFFQVIEKPAS